MTIEIRIPSFGKDSNAHTKAWLRAIHVHLAFALAHHRVGDPEQAEKALARADELTNIGFDIINY